MWWIYVLGILTLCAGLYLGWKGREWKDELDHDIEKAFEDALREK